MNVRFFYAKFECASSISLSRYRWPKYPFSPDEEFIDGELIGLKDQKGCFYLYIVRLSKDTISLVPETRPAYEDKHWQYNDQYSYLPIVIYNKEGDVIGLDGYETIYGVCSGKFRMIHHTGPDGKETWDMYRDGQKMGPVPWTESKVLKEQVAKESERVDKRKNGEEDEKVDVTTAKREGCSIPKWWGFDDKKVFEVNRDLVEYLARNAEYRQHAERFMWDYYTYLFLKECDVKYHGAKEEDSFFSFI